MPQSFIILPYHSNIRCQFLIRLLRHEQWEGRMRTCVVLGKTLTVYLDTNKLIIKSYYLLFYVFYFTSPSAYNPYCAPIPR